MALADSFKGHGTFILGSTPTVSEYGSLELLGNAMSQCGMTHAWVRIHGQGYDFENDKRYGNTNLRAVVDSLKGRGIHVAGWGWCQGEDPQGEAAMALSALSKLGLQDYIADIEEGVNNSQWSASSIEQFLGTVRDGLPAGGGLGLSTHGLIDWHKPELMNAAETLVDVFAPQVYWYNFPNSKMRSDFGDKYALHDPVSYVNLCLDRWKTLVNKPIILSGQAEWEQKFPQSEAEQKLITFVSGFNRWAEVPAVNWWHFGGGSAMSHAMWQSLVNAQLDKKLNKTLG